MDNILYGQKRKKRADVEKLIKDLKLEKYIENMPKGLDTYIVQNRNGISGGQAQNVDHETRTLMMNALKSNIYDGIVIIISHYTEGMEFIKKVINIDNTVNTKTKC
ncbi:MAG: hypothetical protein WCD89_17820 [Anaerocolumna sp.]